MSNSSVENYLCSDKGLLLPFINENTWNKGARAFIYLLGMLWCFLGVAVASDAFMCGIEHITSKTRSMSIPNPEGNGVKVIEVKIWNNTVANLTLLAFGTSAPEILLSVIEICGHRFTAGQLGPGTIVGSAAFNLFVITAICIISIPNGETRRIRNFLVFAITTTFGIFAYVWLILVLVVITPEIVEVWEAIITLLMFPAMILLAYAADKGLCWKRNKVSSETEIVFNTHKTGSIAGGSAEIMQVARELARNHKFSEDEAAIAMTAKMAVDTPKPCGWYRVQATRVITGGHRLIPPYSRTFEQVVDRVMKNMINKSKSPRVMLDGAKGTLASRQQYIHSFGKAEVEFTAATCAVQESEGYVRIGVKREGDMSKEIKIGLETIDGTAEAGINYRPIKQMMTFSPEEMSRDVCIHITDNNIWQPDKFFFTKLFYHSSGSTDADVIIGKLSINQVTIVKDDEPGKLEFSKPSYIVKESSGSAQLVIRRVNGADGEVKVTWKTQDMSARAGHEYLSGMGTVIFKHGETSKVISVGIYGVGNIEHEPNFHVELSNPTGAHRLGAILRQL